MKRLMLIGAAALLAAHAGGVMAQNQNAFAMAADYAKSAKENADLLRQYTWNMRVSMTKDGDTKPPQLYLVRFTIDGTLQKTLLTPAPELHGGPIMRTIEKEQMVLAKEQADKLAHIVKEYTTPSPGTMLDFYMKAKYVPGADDTLEIEGSDFVTPGDKVDFWVDKKTKKPHRFTFRTSMDGNPLTGVVNYEQVTGGPHYAARIEINMPNDSESAVVETFNYHKSN